MKLKTFILSAVIVAAACVSACVSPAAKQYEAPALADYFSDTTSGVKTGGVQIVTINTPKGKFQYGRKN
jgi:proline iminopeptidase